MYAFTLMGNLELSINPTLLIACLWTVELNWSTRKEYANSRIWCSLADWRDVVYAPFCHILWRFSQRLIRTWNNLYIVRCSLDMQNLNYMCTLWSQQKGSLLQCYHCVNEPNCCNHRTTHNTLHCCKWSIVRQSFEQLFRYTKRNHTWLQDVFEFCTCCEEDKEVL